MSGVTVVQARALDTIERAVPDLGDLLTAAERRRLDALVAKAAARFDARPKVLS